MLNYIKSELYRAAHSREIREMALVFTGLVFLMNLVLSLLKGMEHFRYGITSFSYSMAVAMPMVYCFVAGDVAVMLYEGDRRNGTERNSIACGISRLEVFAGKCIVTLLTCLALLALVLPVYIASASLFLDYAGPTTVADLLMEIPAVSLIAIAALVLAVALLELFDSSIGSILAWLAVWVFVPKLLLLAGTFLPGGNETILEIAMWMPVNFFSAMSQVNMSQCDPLWDTAAGMARCLLSGAAGILVFGGLGVLLLRKRDI